MLVGGDKMKKASADAFSSLQVIMTKITFWESTHRNETQTVPYLEIL